MLIVFGIFLACVGVFLVVILTYNVWEMRKNKDLHFYPSITRCRLCDNRVFAWQQHERRAMAVSLDNPNRLLVSVGGSCIVHTQCKGTPTMHASIQRGA